MIKRILFLTAIFFNILVIAQTNVTLLSNLDEHNSTGYNDIWGYVDPMGNEYALLGVRNGTAIISLANPSNPIEVAFIPATYSIWRDIKVHEQYAYVVSEQTNDGLQIIDLSNLPNSATLVNQIDTLFGSAHNIFIDNGFAYVIGTNVGGMQILDLSDPVNPIQTATYLTGGSIHDVYVWNDTVIACMGYSGEYHLIDVTDKSNPQFISSSTSLPGIYSHSGWMTEDKRYFYGTEEFNQRDITVWDLQDRSSWNLVVPSWQTNSNATVHNLFIKGNYAHISYYTDGYVVLDISDPLNPFLVGEYSTSEMWGCYPFLPSGITICSDMDNGLYVFQFIPDDVPPTINHTPITEVNNSDSVTLTAQIVDNNSVSDANLRYRTTLNGNTSNWSIVNDPNGPTNNIYEFEIPGQVNNTIVEYYISAQDNNNLVSTLPEGGSGINPPGSVPPSTFFSYSVMIPAPPIFISVTPAGDTTIAPDGIVQFHVNAVDTSGFDLDYSWFKNGDRLSFQSNSYVYLAMSNPDVPRVDTIRTEVTNGFYTIDFTWLVTVENPTGLGNGNLPLEYSLRQNYPNPFNPSTQIKFSIPNSEFVNLSIYSALGEKVRELVNEFLSPGEYTITFDAAHLSSGFYIAKIIAGSYTQVIKMSLLK
ncbi:LVIVD repeat protein [bacterium BMS3Abin03]|nr:LVIVD repeat protein [bacterium BMS3Abin03]